MLCGYWPYIQVMWIRTCSFRIQINCARIRFVYLSSVHRFASCTTGVKREAIHFLHLSSVCTDSFLALFKCTFSHQLFTNSYWVLVKCAQIRFTYVLSSMKRFVSCTYQMCTDSCLARMKCAQIRFLCSWSVLRFVSCTCQVWTKSFRWPVKCAQIPFVYLLSMHSFISPTFKMCTDSFVYSACQMCAVSLHRIGKYANYYMHLLEPLKSTISKNGLWAINWM